MTVHTRSAHRDPDPPHRKGSSLHLQGPDLRHHHLLLPLQFAVAHGLGGIRFLGIVTGGNLVPK